MIWIALLAGLLLGAVGMRMRQCRRSAQREPMLRELDQQLERIARSRDYGQRLSVPTDAELAAFVVTLNRVLEQIEARDRVLQRGNELLEERVAERTEALEGEIERRQVMQEQLGQARDEANRAATAKSEFLANMSHEIRTPLIGVIGMAELLQDSELDELQAQYAETLVGSAQHLLTLINDILDYSRIAARGMELEQTEFDLHELCYEIATLMTPNAHDRGVELVVDYAADAPRRLIGDSARVRQQLINLAGNAVKFTEEGSVTFAVRLEAQRGDRNEISIAVRDTGIGIPSEKLELIFEQFAQADASTTRQFGGSGLGLAITRSLTELMGGRLDVESEVGVGTTFRLFLPFGRVHGQQQLPKPSRDWTAVPALVAMPDGGPAEVLCAMLREFGLRPERIGVPGDEELAARLQLDSGQELPPLVFADAGEEPNRTVSTLQGLATRLGDQSPWFVLMADLVQLGSDGQLQDLVGGSVLRKPVRRGDLLRLLDLVANRGESNSGSDRPLRALLAEDNVVNQRIVAAMLNRCGLQVSLARDGREAVDIASRGHFDLILMDCHMPVMDGLRASRAIRELPGEASGSLIVGMLSNDRSVVGDACLRAGMNEVISKPITFAKLEALTQRHFHPVMV